MKPFTFSLQQKSNSLEGTMILPAHLYAKVKRLGFDPCCPNKKAYIVDDDGRVHVLKYQGMIPRPGEPGYKEFEGEGEPN